MLIEFLVQPKYNKGLTRAMPYEERHSLADTRQHRVSLARGRGKRAHNTPDGNESYNMKPSVPFSHGYFVKRIGMNARPSSLCVKRSSYI